MSTTENLLKRKLAQGGVARSPLPEPDFVGETFARHLEEGFRPLVKTMVSAMVLECKIIKLADALQDISVPTMLGLLEVEDSKAQGLLAVDTDLTYHLIDLMLGGDHASAPVPITRSFTSIDMGLCRLPLEALANAFMGAVASCFGRPVTKSLDVIGQRQDITQIRIAPFLCCLDFQAEDFNPLRPGKAAGFRQSHRQGKGLRFPRLIEDRTVLIPGQ